MIPALQRGASFLASLPSHLSFSSIRSAASTIFQQNIGFLKRYHFLALPSLLALGYDVRARTPIFSGRSWTGCIAAFNLGLFGAWKLCPKALPFLPESIAMTLAPGFCHDPSTFQALIQKGYSVNAKSLGGLLTPMHTAAGVGNLDAINILYQNGANLNGLNRKGESPLYHCLLTYNNLPAVRKLIRLGADPFAGKSVFALARNNVPGILAFLQAEDISAFNPCKNFHDVSATLSPPSEELPEDWEEIVDQIPRSPNLKKLAKGSDALKAKIKTYEEFWREIVVEGRVPMVQTKTPEEREAFLNTLPARVPFKIILNALLKTNPLFKKAWELANTPPITLKIDRKALKGRYYPDAHTIVLPGTNLKALTRSLIFETGNALQRNSFLACHKPDHTREHHAILLEWFESFSQGLVNNAFNPMINKPIPAPKSFPDRWKKMHRIYVQDPVFGRTPHPDVYRKDWDLRCFTEFFKLRRRLLEDRLDELRE